MEPVCCVYVCIPFACTTVCVYCTVKFHVLKSFVRVYACTLYRVRAAIAVSPFAVVVAAFAVLLLLLLLCCAVDSEGRNIATFAVPKARSQANVRRSFVRV